MPAPAGSQGLLETELVKKVLGQPADLSLHGAADRFNIDDKMLPYLLGADLS